MAEPLFVTATNKKELTAALANSNNPRLIHSHALSYDRFKDVVPGISVRDQFTRRDYEYYRPSEKVPTEPKEIIKACFEVYERNPILHNVIDLMAEFICQGFRLVHKQPRIEEFHQVWARKINLAEKVDQFVRMLLCGANVIIKRGVGKLSQKWVRELRAVAADGFVKIETPIEPGPLEIPWNYTIFDPRVLEVFGGELAAFSKTPMYYIRLSENVARVIKNPRDKEERLLVRNLPDYIKEAASKPDRTLLLDPERTFSYHYKKNDWQVWALPIAAPILSEFILYEKHKLADSAALDGAISHIRLWKLGSLDKDNPIIPTDAAFAQLEEQLLNAPANGGVMDLIYGPAIELQETSTEVHRFLGEEKYKSTLNSIHIGLGLPSILSGSSASSTHTTNYFGLKTLVERLNYGRSVLNSFLSQELQFMQKAWGFRYPAEPEYSNISMTDEAAERRLLIDLADRDLISFETLQRHFKHLPGIEEARIIRDMKKREKKKVPRKASPFHTNEELELKRIALQTSVATPSEVGLELEESEPDELKRMKQMQQGTSPVGKPKGQPGQGRPKNKKDSQKRKRKQVKPKTKTAAYVSLATWTNKIFKEISKVVSKLYLESLNKTALTKLTVEETENLENLKLVTLCNISPHNEVGEADIIHNLVKMSTECEHIIANYYKYREEMGINSADEQRQLMINSYVEYHMENENVYDSFVIRHED